MDESLRTLEVNGCRIVPGELAFMYRSESADFLYGNIEAVNDTHVTVSFEKPTWERRDPAVEIPLDAVYVAEHLNGRTPGKDYTYTPEELVFKRTSTTTVEPLAVLACQRNVGDPLLVIRVRLQAKNNWVAFSDAFAVQRGDIAHPRTFSAIQRYRFCSPVHPLFDIVRHPAGLLIDKHQASVLHLVNVDVPVDNHFQVHGHEVAFVLRAHYLVASMLGGVAPDQLVNETLTPAEQESLHWEASVAFSGASTNIDASDYKGAVSVIPRQVVVAHGERPIVATAEVYLGAPFEAWSSHVYYREEPVNMFLITMGHGPIPNAVAFECFEKPAIIIKPPKHEGVDHDYLSVIRLGIPLGEHEHAVLSAFIGYITGGRASNVLTETYANNEKIRTTIHDRAEPTVRKHPPVPVTRPWLYSRLITPHFADMLLEFKRWREIDKRSFEALFHHYAEGVDSGYPVTRALKLAVAFEAFVNLVTLDNAVDERIVESKEDYDELKRELQGTLEAFAAVNREKISSDAEGRFALKFEQSFNTGSNRKRFNKFWELVPIKVSKKEKELIHDLRNDVVHNGFLGDPDEEQDALADDKSASKLCDVLNRAVLHYAGYTGPVFSAETGQWIDAVTGDLFHVPVIPRGPTIEIKHETPVPAPSSMEQIALEALRELQRRGEFQLYVEDPAVTFPPE